MSVSDPAALPGPFVPVLLLCVALAGWLGFQAVQLILEARQLEAARARQETQMQNATRARASLDAVAASTAKLANQGNASAQLIVDELRRRGITINPEAAAQAK